MFRKLLIFLLLCCLTNPCFAARGFDTTYGAGTTDKVQTSVITTANNNFSLSFWFYINASSGLAIASRIIDIQGTNEDIIFEYNPATTVTTTAINFSTTQGAWTITAPTTGSWHNIVETFNGSSSVNNPVIYLDGASVTVTNTVPPVGTFITPISDNVNIGNRAAGDRVWDGKLAQIAYWDGTLLSANEAKALSKGASPLKIRNSKLKIYIPLYGKSGEPSWGFTRTTQTVTGTAFQPHPAVSAYPLIWNNGQ